MNRRLKSWISKPTVSSRPLKWSATWSSSSIINSQIVNHISSVTRACCYFNLRRIRQVRRCLNEHWLKVLVQALILSRIDYCNSVLAGLPKTTLQPLTSVLQAAVWPTLIRDLSTTRPHSISNCWPTGFHSMPEFTSRSVSSCTINTPTLHYTISPPWSHPAPPSCPGWVCDLPPKAISSALDPAWSLQIEPNQSMVRLYYARYKCHLNCIALYCIVLRCPSSETSFWIIWLFEISWDILISGVAAAILYFLIPLTRYVYRSLIGLPVPRENMHSQWNHLAIIYTSGDKLYYMCTV